MSGRPDPALLTLLNPFARADGLPFAGVLPADRVAAWLVAVGRPACSAATGGCCKARQKLPEDAVRRLALEAGQALHAAAPGGWRWRG